MYFVHHGVLEQEKQWTFMACGACAALTEVSVGLVCTPAV